MFQSSIFNPKSISYDLRGLGGTPKAKPGLGSTDYIKYILHIIDYLFSVLLHITFFTLPEPYAIVFDFGQYRNPTYTLPTR